MGRIELSEVPAKKGRIELVSGPTMSLDTALGTINRSLSANRTGAAGSYTTDFSTQTASLQDLITSMSATYGIDVTALTDLIGQGQPIVSTVGGTE